MLTQLQDLFAAPERFKNPLKFQKMLAKREIICYNYVTTSVENT